MQYIKIFMSKGKDYSMSKDLALKIFNSEKQVYFFTDKNGNWTGKSINKAFIVSTDVDEKATKEYIKKQEADKEKKEAEKVKPLSEEEKSKINNKLKAIRNAFGIKK